MNRIGTWLTGVTALAVVLVGCSGGNVHPDAAADVAVDHAQPDVVVAVDARPDVQADVPADVQSDQPAVDTGPDVPPTPSPVDAGSTRCLVSADCPSGTHCDLAQCVQDCSTAVACAAGATCSARARCLAAGALDRDTPPSPLPTLLAVSPAVVSLNPGVTAFDFTLSATGHVAFRIEPSEPWLNVATTRGEFDNMLVVHATIDPTMIPSGTDAANVLVYSSAGNGLVAVRVPPSIDGTYRGALSYDSIVMPTVSPAGTTTPTNLGTTQFSLWVHSDGTVRARVDPDHSLVWPSSTTGPAEGSGTLTPGTATTAPHLDLRLFQLLDATAVQPLFGLETPVAVASPLPSLPTGRELILSLNAGPGGTLTGTVVERIHGLSAVPIEMHGTARLSWMIGVPAPAITLGPTPTMPGGPARTVGIQPATCALLPTGAGICSLGATAGERASCLLGHMNRAFGLHTFYAPTLAPAHYTTPASAPTALFALPTTGTLGTGGANPYTGTRTACQSDLGADLRADRDSSIGGQGCVNPAEVQCTRWLAGTLFPPSDTLMRYQFAFNVARAWSELYLLVGNQSLVDAIAASTTGLDPTVGMRTAYINARAAFDAGLTRILDPRLLGELRAVPVALATTTVPDSVVPNDRTAVRRAADLLLSSSDATAEVLTIDTASSNATQLVSLRQRATRDAVIYWLAGAVIADLDAAYRLTPTTAGVPEVGRIGTMMTNLDQRVLAMSPTYTPLGIARSYVPLLARTSSTDMTTNYERVTAFANSSVAFARSRQDLALAAARDYDASISQASAAIAQAQSTYIDGIQQVCGSDFAVAPTLPGGAYTFGTRAGDPTPVVSPNLARCGVDLAGHPVGTLADQLAAIRTAQLQIDAARANEQQLADTITTRSQTIALAHSMRVEDISFRQANNDMIYALGYAKAAADATAAAASDLSGQSALNLGLGSISAAVDFAATFASGALQTEMDKLSNMNDMHAASTDASIEYLNDMQGLKELMLQTQGLRVQTAIQLNEQARAQTALATMIEGLLRQIDDYNGAIGDAASLLQQDPSVRLQRDHSSIISRQAFVQARVNVYLSVRALEYETNTPLDQMAQSVFEAQNVGQLETIMSSCVNQAWSGGTGSWLALVGSTSSFTREISIRRDIFGITGPRTDADTGLTISEGEQFRRQLFARPYQDAAGTVYPAISFATTLSAPGGLFTSTLCNDRVTTLEAQLVGPSGAAGLGDNTAFVSLLANGGSIVRACDSAPGSDVLRSWNLRPPGSLAPASIQAGVNSYGIASPNQSLTGYSVAQSQWILAIPDCGTAHENCDVNPGMIDDIQLRIVHSAISAGSAVTTFAPTCHY